MLRGADASSLHEAGEQQSTGGPGESHSHASL